MLVEGGIVFPGIQGKVKGKCLVKVSTKPT